MSYEEPPINTDKVESQEGNEEKLNDPNQFPELCVELIETIDETIDKANIALKEVGNEYFEKDPEALYFRHVISQLHGMKRQIEEEFSSLSAEDFLNNSERQWSFKYDYKGAIRGLEAIKEEFELKE